MVNLTTTKPLNSIYYNKLLCLPPVFIDTKLSKSVNLPDPDY